MTPLEGGDRTRALDQALDDLFAEARAGTRAPAGLAGRVLAQVALAPRTAAGPAAAAATFVPGAEPPPGPADAFWLRAAAAPPVVLAFAVAGVVAGWPGLYAAGGRALALRLSAWLAGGIGAFGHGALAAVPALGDPLVSGTLAAFLAVALALLARDSARAAERWTVRLLSARSGAWPGAAG